MLKIGVIGFGTVGSGVYERLLSSKDELEAILKKEIQIKNILVKDRQKDRNDRSAEQYITSDPNEFFRQPYDIVFEAIGGIDPAKEYIVKLMKSGTSVITANKELIAKYGKELEKIAEKHEVYLGFEAAVGGGIPIVNSFKTLFATTPIHAVTGILNGTTNYILTEMKEKNRHFNEVLAEAKHLGYAEADPTDDIEGFDAFYKLRILSRLAFNSWPYEQDFSCSGISKIEPEALEFAEKYGLAIKLIAQISNKNGAISGFVSPSFVSPVHPLYNINGVTNGICIDGATVERITISGPGAGKEATANSMVEDFVLHEQFRCFERKVLQPPKDSIDEGIEIIIFVNELEKEQVISSLLAISKRIETEEITNGKLAMKAKLVQGKGILDLPPLLQKSCYPLLGTLLTNKVALPS